MSGRLAHLITLLGVALLTFVGCARTAPTPKAPDREYGAGYVVYEHPVHGFTLKHPGHWALLDKTSREGQVLLIGDQRLGIGLAVIVEFVPLTWNYTIDGYINALAIDLKTTSNEENRRLRAVKRVELVREEAGFVDFEENDDGEPLRSNVYAFLTPTTVYLLWMTSPVEHYEIGREITWEIANTFKPTK